MERESPGKVDDEAGKDNKIVDVFVPPSSFQTPVQAKLVLDWIQSEPSISRLEGKGERTRTRSSELLMMNW